MEVKDVGYPAPTPRGEASTKTARLVFTTVISRHGKNRFLLKIPSKLSDAAEPWWRAGTPLLVEVKPAVEVEA